MSPFQRTSSFFVCQLVLGLAWMLLLGDLSSVVMAFSVEPSSSRNAMPTAVSRASFFHHLTSITLVTSSWSVLPSVIHADVTSSLAESAALRNVKLAAKTTNSQLSEYIDMNEYIAIKEVLRVAPFSNLRKSGSTLVRAASATEDLQKGYQKMIASLENLDSTASLGMRGRKLSETQLRQSFVDFAGALDAFVARADPLVGGTTTAPP